MTQDDPAEPPAPTPPKVDPETMVLRGTPARAIRFKRNAVLAIAGITALAVALTAWIALAPGGLHLAAPQSSPSQVAQAPAETLAGLPSTYADVPKLGPPLPGDLGQPILDHQGSLGVGMVGNDRMASENQREKSARNQKLAELKAARESTILVQPSVTPAEPSPAIAGSDAPSGQIPSSDKLALSPAGDPNAQQRKADFQKTPDKGSDVDPHRLVAMPSPYTLMAGTIMPASLITGLNSDLPGLVIAQTTENIYDTATGTILLVPQGSRLIGSYDSVVAFGQSRALVVWQRIILPDGSSIQIDNLPATDAAGYAGLADQVDYHTWQLLKGVGLSTLLGVGTEVSIGNDESDLVRAIRQSTQQSASQAGQQVVSKQLNVQPTIKIRPGWPLRVIVQKDLVLRPWKGSRPWQN